MRIGAVNGPAPGIRPESLSRELMTPRAVDATGSPVESQERNDDMGDAKYFLGVDPGARGAVAIVGTDGHAEAWTFETEADVNAVFCEHDTPALGTQPARSVHRRRRSVPLEAVGRVPSCHAALRRARR